MTLWNSNLELWTWIGESIDLFIQFYEKKKKFEKASLVSVDALNCLTFMCLYNSYFQK